MTAVAIVLPDRCAETTTTTGTGTVTLAGATTGYQSLAAVGDGKRCYYTIAGGLEWEVGIGTYTLSGTTLSRTTIFASSNSGSAVSFSAGSKDVFVDLPSKIFPGRSRIGQVVTTGSQATIVFSSIPDYFTDLEVVLQSRDTASGTSNTNVFCKINADGTSTNYDAVQIAVFTGSTVSSATTPATSANGAAIYTHPNDGATANACAVGTIKIPNYAGTAWDKQAFSHSYERDGTTPTAAIQMRGFTWKSTAAITTLTFTSAGTAFKDGSIATLYGDG